MPQADVWWQVYPLGAVGAPIREPHPATTSDTEGAGDHVVHRLGHLLPWVDHAAGLGATGLILGPVFASETHGYDTIDHRRVDPRLGDEDDLLALFAAAHGRGLRVVLDGVFNHVGTGHPLYRQALEEGEGSSAARLFRIDWAHRTGARPAVFEGHGGLVLLDHANPAIDDLVAGAMLHWLDAGADGWRLDAAYAVDTAFWTRVVGRVRAAHRDAVLIGEVIHGDYPAIVAATGMDTVTQYELWKATWSSIVDRNLFELASALERHNRFLTTFRPQTFVGNHDVTRIATQAGDAGAAVALAVLMTVGGSPSVYAGDEYGLHALKEERWGGDDAIRPALPPDPGAAPEEVPGMLALHRRLIGLRRRHPWLAEASTRVVSLENARMVYETAANGRSLQVTIDLAESPRAEVRADDEVVDTTAA